MTHEVFKICILMNCWTSVYLMCFSTLILLSLLVFKLTHWSVVTYSGWILNPLDKNLVAFDSFLTVWCDKEIPGLSYTFPASDLESAWSSL